MEKTIKISDATARKIYPTSPEPLKTILEENFGKDFFSENMIDVIKSVEDAFAKTGVRPVINDTDTPDEIAYKILKQVVKAYNNDPNFPDWANSKQPKYSIWWDMKSGLGLSYDGCESTASASTVGSRLVFKNLDHAKHVANHPEFHKLFVDFLTVKK